MSHILHLKIITPEAVVFEEDALQVTLPTTEGEITILPDHIPLVSSIDSGDIVVTDINGELVPMAVIGGLLELHNNRLTVLADFAELVGELTETEIAKARAIAEELRVQGQSANHVDYEHFKSELEKSITRTRIADKWRRRKYRK